MISHQNRIFRIFNVFSDSIIVLFSIFLASLLRAQIVQDFSFSDISIFFKNPILLLSLVLLWNILLYENGLYPTNRLRSLAHVAWIIFKATFIGVAICGFVIFFLEARLASRLTLTLFGFFSFGLLFLKEISVRETLKRSREKGTGVRNVIIIGEEGLVSKIEESIHRNTHLGLNIVFTCCLDSRSCEELEQCEFGGNIQVFMLEKNIDNVIFAVGKEKLSDVEDLILKCEEFGAEIWLYADFFETMFAKKEIDNLDENIPFLIFRTTPGFSWQLVCKKIFDLAGSLILLILTSPLFVITAIGIKLSSPGPVFFKQKRVGLHGRKFIFYKFRSMYSDAEQRLDELKGRNMMTGPVFKVKDDPRIFPFGKFIRKFSIDELPQLWNVLKGEMSLVGPRPPLPMEVAKYRGWQRRRLSMKPGLTCLWQVEGRSRILDFNKWAELDLKYIDNWSLWLDIVIILKTIPAVLLRVGAE